MGKKSLFLLFLVVFYALLITNTASGYQGGEIEEGGGDMGGEGGEMGHDSRFLLRESEHVIQSEAGDMRVVRGGGGGKRMWRSPMHIGFITMEPNSLFIPQYLDSTLILFVRQGEARVGHIYKDEFAEKRLKGGDIYRIGAGSAFYIVNPAEGQRLHIICSIDTSESIGWQWTGFQSFFIGGGLYPISVLAGFGPYTLSAAFNVTIEKLGVLMRQSGGPIVYLVNATHSPSTLWSKFLDLEQHERLSHLKRTIHFELDQDEKESSGWSWRKLLISVFGDENKKGDEKKGSKAPDPYNLYDRNADFENEYGWSKALTEHDYSPLAESDIGVYIVNLTAGSMMAPHFNPRAIEYGIVLRGSGTIQIVFPNGTLAMNAKVSEGDVFFIPRYFPFCQIASRTGPLEFFGYTTSAQNNMPQFLVGRYSLLETMSEAEMAAAFGVSVETYRNITKSQRKYVILPSTSAAPPEVKIKAEAEMKEFRATMIKNLGNDMIMGFG